ncbi:hypothetical protein EYF80_018815 [Liparis tanakae]|uniref:Uncharacterized protein n=1 Tax=Liparis tanakae TaxID=230148 RepID=A0A4Z2HYR4_9TELE|nr:hypothetical protein EYF80_018815 [Liparis tanakae]
MALRPTLPLASGFTSAEREPKAVVTFNSGQRISRVDENCSADFTREFGRCEAPFKAALCNDEALILASDESRHTFGTPVRKLTSPDTRCRRCVTM